MNMNQSDKANIIIVAIIAAMIISVGGLVAGYNMYTTKAYLEHGYEMVHLPNVGTSWVKPNHKEN